MPDSQSDEAFLAPPHEPVPRDLGPYFCALCGGIHTPDSPHKLNSTYYRSVFKHIHGRYPGWNDALAHCTEETKAAWKEALDRFGLYP